MTFAKILLIIVLKIISAENYNNDLEVIVVSEDGTYNFEEIHSQPEDYNFEDYSTDNELEKNYVKPNKNHDRKLIEKKKRQSNIESDEDYTYRYRTELVTEAAYDYDKFKLEYDHDLEELKKSQALNETEFQPILKSQCTGFFKGVVFAIICFARESVAGQTNTIREAAKESFVRLLKWYGILLPIFFAYCWAHNGYCNWFCCSKHCFPEDGYEEIKQELVLNPPGSLVKKIIPKTGDQSKAVFEKEYFKPSETENYLYKSIWNDIYRV